ncbi:hypothetical protein C4K18_4204 [Pseudomonas chlororaphis subsp. aurantiaca]|nr:hypothetical protein C4K18_4204 [Pseudomonas chlororaphis subsp. aurantiaca]
MTQGQNHVLSKALTAYPSMDKYHKDLRASLDAIKEMAEHAEQVAPLSVSDYTGSSEWAQAHHM